jgi:hypothetical protein
MKRLLITLLLFSQLTLLVAQPFPSLFNAAPSTAEIFGEGFISTALSERDFALSPDGTEIFYTLQTPLVTFQTIMHSKKESDGKWSKPVIASFAGNYSDLEPAFTSDGKKLYFASNRPISGSDIKDFDIWMVEKNSHGWGKPTNLGAPINTSEDEFYPSITNSGNLYYTAAYKTAIGKEDIFVAINDGGKFREPVPLDSTINSKTYEFNSFVAPDESYIIFTSYGRKDDTGRGDLYMSVKDAAGKWLTARNLKLINSDRLDYCPFVSFDKNILFFTSERNKLAKAYPHKPMTIEALTNLLNSTQNGLGDIYWIRLDKVMEFMKGSD